MSRLNIISIIISFIIIVNYYCKYMHASLSRPIIIRAVWTHFKRPRFLGFFKNLKSRKLRFLGFLIFESEFLLFHVKLFKFL